MRTKTFLKYLSVLICLIMMISLASCQGGNDKETDAPTAVPTEAPTEDNKPTEAPTDNEQNTVSPLNRQELLGKMKQSFGNGAENDSAEFIADIFAQGAAISSFYSSVAVKIVEDDIYFEDILYEKFEVVDNSQITYQDILTKLERSIEDEEFDSIIESLKKCEKCYIFETQDEKHFSKRIGVLEIDETYYLLSFFDSDAVARIYYAGERSADTPKRKLVDQMKRDFDTATEESKIEFTAELLAGNDSADALYTSIDVKISLDNIYFEGVLYDQLEIIDNSQVKYNDEILKNANASVSDEELENIIEALRNSEQCYRFYAKGMSEFSPCVAIYKLGDAYYFASFVNNRTVSAIHYITK